MKQSSLVCQEEISRREFMKGAGALAAMARVPAWAGNTAHGLGEWLDDAAGLPVYHYMGPLTFAESKRADGARMLSDDPYFLMGNYRLTLFTHASGQFQILTGERAWGRVNQGDARFSGANAATISVNGRGHDLVGVDADAAHNAEKFFGVGFARYEYLPEPELHVSRTLSTPPSMKIAEGAAGFLAEVLVKNSGPASMEIQYAESCRALYQQLFATWATEQQWIHWEAEEPRIEGTTAYVGFAPKAAHTMAFPPKGQMCPIEQEPPSLVVHALSEGLHVRAETDASGAHQLGVRWSGTLQAGESRLLKFLIGYARDTSKAALQAEFARWNPVMEKAYAQGSAFAQLWRKRIPEFAEESDAAVRREMQWNTAALESMATWRAYYNETVIPQGMVYDYEWGLMASSRDLAQHALPLCHTNPALARSVLRFLMKRTLPDGEIKLNDAGFGWSPSGAQQTSDQQLFFFLLLAEYLRVTRDASILREKLGYYPLENSGSGTGLEHTRQAFLFLRDRVGVGAHGLVRRWNSDWNDMFFFWPTRTPYNRMFEAGESLMNSTMAIAILGDLTKQLESVADRDAAELVEAMREYRERQREAWMRDMEGRTFSRRAWTSPWESLGDEEMWLEPQGFALLIPEFAVERKRQLWQEAQQRLLRGEAMGARQIEKPVEQPGTPPGTRENGGFWYALNGPLILGVATFDKQAARAMLQRMSLANHAQRFPKYWTGAWTNADATDSSLVATEGLSEYMPWCAHAHAWPLYCWLRLREGT